MWITVHPPTRMPGGTKDTVMMTVSIVMPADRVCVRSWLNMSTCGIRERLTPRDTEQSQRRQPVHLGARKSAGGATGLDLG